MELGNWKVSGLFIYPHTYNSTRFASLAEFLLSLCVLLAFMLPARWVSMLISFTNSHKIFYWNWNRNKIYSKREWRKWVKLYYFTGNPQMDCVLCPKLWAFAVFLSFNFIYSYGLVTGWRKSRKGNKNMKSHPVETKRGLSVSISAKSFSLDFVFDLLLLRGQ